MLALKADPFGDDFFDCDMPEEYSLTDLLQQVRALSQDAEQLPFTFATDEDVLVWALALLCDSPLGRTLASDARFEDWSIELDEVEDGRHIADLQMRVLILPRFMPSAVALGRSQYFRNMFLAEFCRGLRGIWNLSLGVRDPRDLTINDQVVWNRLVQADHDLLLLSMAWELREADYPDLWRHLIGSDLGELAIAWSALLERQPPLSFPQMLMRLFPRWMECDTLLNAVDHRTLEHLDHFLQSPGSGRPCGSRRLEGSDLLKLSALPEEVMYLKPFITMLLDNDDAARMPDPINEAHLLHLLQDLTAMRTVHAGFRDADLARKIFPDLPLETSLDTLA